MRYLCVRANQINSLQIAALKNAIYEQKHLCDIEREREKSLIETERD